MSNIRNVELNTNSKVVSSKASQITIGEQVPAGMKRWVTFLTLDSMPVTGAKSVRLYLASVATDNPTMTALIATSNRKMLLDLRASGLALVTGSAATGLISATRKNDLTPRGPPLMIPDKPDVNKPLFSIAGGKFLGAYVSNTTANVFIQSFDE